MQAPNVTQFISCDQQQSNEVDKQHLKRKEKNHCQKTAS